jgi:hypothetical protein
MMPNQKKRRSGGPAREARLFVSVLRTSCILLRSKPQPDGWGYYIPGLRPSNAPRSSSISIYVVRNSSEIQRLVNPTLFSHNGGAISSRTISNFR